MCGIAGLLRSSRDHVARDIQRMGVAIAHRGPDDLGFLVLDGGTPTVRDAHPPDGRLALAHRRLSILDLGRGGWQPMASRDGRYQVVFNGEIYNYKELREQLRFAGLTFETGSDTEVLLAAWAHWGSDALPRFVGMFAFALLDVQAHTLTLARDPFGIKPLYHASFPGGFAFASEAKALLELPEVDRTADPARLYDYLRFGLTDHGADTLVSGIRQLPPGHLAVLSLDDPSPIEPRAYWRLEARRRDDLGFAEAAAQVRQLFLDNVNLHLRSDVPVGAALSGGIDSSSIVMAMRHLAPEAELHAFGYVSEDPKTSEERYMTLVAGEAGATLHRTCPNASELVRDLDAMIETQDFPFQATSMYAQYRVFGLARDRGIKVMLDGQGADELLGGYRFYVAARLASLLRRGEVGAAAGFLLRAGGRLGGESARLFLQAGGLLLPPELQGAARRLVGAELAPAWLNAAWFERRGVHPSSPFQARDPEILRDQLHQAVTTTSLPALLRYEDRNSMAHGVESRVPFLTPALATFLLSLPEEYLVGPDGTSKAVFRAAMRGLVPDAVLARRDKVGFTTPESAWLRELAPWVERVLASEGAHRVAPLNLAAARAEWQGVLAGKRGFTAHVWRWINLIRWADRYGVAFEGAA